MNTKLGMKFNTWCTSSFLAMDSPQWPRSHGWVYVSTWLTNQHVNSQPEWPHWFSRQILMKLGNFHTTLETLQKPFAQVLHNFGARLWNLEACIPKHSTKEVFIKHQFGSMCSRWEHYSYTPYPTLISYFGIPPWSLGTPPFTLLQQRIHECTHYDVHSHHTSTQWFWTIRIMWWVCT